MEIRDNRKENKDNENNYAPNKNVLTKTKYVSLFTVIR